MIKRKEIDWSPFQKNIFKDIAEGKGHTVVVARAGCSKTTVLVECVKHLPKKKKALFVAFNKKIAEELDDKINRSYVLCSTVHSLGFRTLKAMFGSIALDPMKTMNLTQLYLQEKGMKKFEKEVMVLAYSLTQCISLCKARLIDIPSKIDELMDQYDIEPGMMEREEFIKCVCVILGRCKKSKESVDFDDMVWMNAVYATQPIKYDYVFVDELQDLSAAQLSLVLSACKKDGRIIAVGDPEQVLYGFCGVEINSVDLVIKKLDAKTLTLPISYRCPKEIIKLAQEIVPDIQSAPNAIQGIVKKIPEKNFLLYVKPGDYILSRVNAPLIGYCLSLIKMGVAANILGRDVGNSLAYMIKRSECKNIPDFMKWLYHWRDAEVKRLAEKNRNADLIFDKVACMEILCADQKSLDDVLDNIKILFSDDDEKRIVLLSSIHKIKGKEANRVFVLNDTLKINGDKSEQNIRYVAYTRAKSELFLVSKKMLEETKEI